LFGDVDSVSCQNRYWDVPDSDYFTACLCNAQLKFNNGVIAEVTYGKGDVFWHSQRTLEIYGDKGTMVFHGEKGTLIKQENKTEIPVTPRRGLFAQDTAMVLDYLFNQQPPLYVTPQASIYALKVANAAHQSACSGKTIQIK
jgi:biliverdin reductase